MNLECVVFCEIISHISYCSFYFLVEEGQVRLTNGTNGILEVYYDGQWGYVCDDGWIDLNGEVVCHILGYVYAISSRISYYFNDVNYRLNFINCIGGEDNLLNCSYEVYTPNYCSSYEHVYISCLPGKQYTVCSGVARFYSQGERVLEKVANPNSQKRIYTLS